MWNLFHKGQKYPWQWCVIGFFLALLAFAGLFQSMMVTVYATEQDAIFQPDLLEAVSYFQFGVVMMFMALAFTLAEVAIIMGLLIFYSLEGPREDVEERRGFSFSLKR
jgi:hypothetical protein